MTDIIHDQDNSLSVKRDLHDLSHLTASQAPTTTTTQDPQLYARFSHRLKHTEGATIQDKIESEIIIQDSAINHYLAITATRKGNNGKISRNSVYQILAAAKTFLKYVNKEITTHAFADLIAWKQVNPLSDTIELAVEDFGAEPPVKTHAAKANRIIGILRDNHAALRTSVSNHFDPDEEDISTEHFLDTYQAMNDECKDALQWSTYYPERATACFRIRLDAFKVLGNYAITWVQTHNDDYANKTKVKHPAIIPLAFFNKVKERAEKAGRSQPFPNHQSLFKWKISAFARQEFNEKLVSNRGRKFFEEMADKAHISPAIAAFLMGDKTKLQQSGHLALIYNTALKPKQLNTIVEEYGKVEPYLDLKNRGNPPTRPLTQDQIRAEIARLTALLSPHA